MSINAGSPRDLGTQPTFRKQMREPVGERRVSRRNPRGRVLLEDLPENRPSGRIPIAPQRGEPVGIRFTLEVPHIAPSAIGGLELYKQHFAHWSASGSGTYSVSNGGVARFPVSMRLSRNVVVNSSTAVLRRRMNSSRLPARTAAAASLSIA